MALILDELHLAARRQVFVKVEAVPGTPEMATPSAADFIPDAFDIQVDPAWEKQERNEARQTFNRSADLVGARPATIRFSVYMRGGSGSGVAGPQAPLWLAGGCQEVIVAVTSVTYKRAAAPNALKYTVGVWMDGRWYRITGALADLFWRHVGGERPVMTFTAQGLTVDPIDAASVTPPALVGVIPVFESAGTTLNLGAAYQVCYQTLEINSANALSPRRCADAAGGLNGYNLTGVRPIATIDYEAVDFASDNLWTRFKDRDEGTLVYQLTGTAGSILGFSSKCAIDEYALGNRDEMDTDDLTLQLIAAAADAEGADYEFVWT